MLHLFRARACVAICSVWPPLQQWMDKRSAAGVLGTSFTPTPSGEDLDEMSSNGVFGNESQPLYGNNQWDGYPEHYNFR